MKRGSTDSRGAEKRSAVGGVLLFGLFQLACAAGFGALCTIPELPRWLEILFTTLAVGCLGLVREFIGSGTLFDVTVLPEAFPRTLLFVMAPGGFFTLAILMAILNHFRNKKA